MNAVKQWARAVASDAAMAGLAYLWVARGIEGAGNVFIFFAWAYAIVGTLAGLLGDMSWFKSQRRPPALATYNTITDILFLCFMVWIGMIWLSIFFLIAAVGLKDARSREPKDKAEASKGGAA